MTDDTPTAHKHVAEVLEYLDDRDDVVIQDAQTDAGTTGYTRCNVTFALKPKNDD